MAESKTQRAGAETAELQAEPTIKWIPMGEPCLMTCDASLKKD